MHEIGHGLDKALGNMACYHLATYKKPLRLSYFFCLDSICLLKDWKEHIFANL